LLFSRRKRGTRSQPPAQPGTVAAAPPAPQSPGAAPLLAPEATATADAAVPVAPGPVPPSLPSAQPPLAVPDSGAATPDGERLVDDLDRFFAALRQVVHDAHEQVAPDEPHAGAIDPSRQPADAPDAPRETASAAEVLVHHHDQGVTNTPALVSSTELAPSTAELVASLEADRDVWRERAIVWRERAMGADVLVKALNAHMSDLQINLEDLRLAMRVLDKDGVAPLEPRAELTAPDLTWRGRSTEREVEAGPQE
jgi:hypothetical protein